MIPTNWLQHRAGSRPEVIAIRDERGLELSYAELYQRASAVAELLPADGGCCVLELDPGLEHAVAIHAAVLAGIPFLTMRSGLPEAERVATLRSLPNPVLPDPELLTVAGRTGSRSGARQAREREGGELIAYVLTSGSSGAPRAVGLSFENFYASAAGSAFNLGVDPQDRWLCCLPVDHIAGLSVLIRSLIYGTGVVVHPGFDLAWVSAEIENGASLISLVPTQLERLLAHGAPLERLRAVLVGGGPLARPALDRALEQGVNVVHTYGLTETCSQVCTLTAADAAQKRGAAGRPLLGTEVAIDRKGDQEILVRGPTVAAGAAAGDGWLRTGDRGRLDRSGFLWVDGRIDDLIVSGGENVVPEEVERVLESHPAVAEAAVVGRKDTEWGAAVTGVVVPVAGEEIVEAALIEHCRSSLAPYKLPKRIEVSAALPRTDNGKLQRRRLQVSGEDL